MTLDSISLALERVLGDRQRHEAQNQATPASNADQYVLTATRPSLRIYVACKSGQHSLVDDRASLSTSEQQRVEVVEAEFVATTPVGLADLPAGGHPRISCPSACKGEMLYLLAMENQQRPAVDYVAFVDDDIAVSISDLLRATEEASRRGSAIFQLQLSEDSYAVWPLLKERRSDHDPQAAGYPEAWSDVDFVEIMAPVIAQSELDHGLLSLLAPFKSGFGWDFYLLPVLKTLYSDFRPGLYRGATMRHERPVQTNNSTRFSHGLTAVEEEELIRAGLIIRLLDGTAHRDRASFLRLLGETWTQASRPVRSIASALGTISERHWQARQLEQQARQLEQKARQQEQKASEEHAQLQACQAEIERLITVHRDEQVAMRAHVAHVDGRNCELNNSLERCRHELHISSEAIDKLNQDINELNQFINELRQSTTWKLGRMLLGPFSWMKRLQKQKRQLPHGAD